MNKQRFLSRLICSLAFIVFCFFQDALAQNDQTLKPVRGAVKDAKGEPIQGVNVVLKGTGDGTTTDEKGNFQINAPRTGVLVFSFIGYTEKEIPVGNLSNLNVQLDPDDKTLSDVVVVGYGTQKKVNVIGSVVTVGPKELTAAPVSTISNALAGRLPGAIVSQSGGEPGKDRASILIRGSATLNNSSPLVVIDGIIGRDLDAVNANDVESISVLKDASAGIYGARAANGVILVTTKRGRTETPLTINYNFYQGFASPTDLPKMADAVQYASMIREMQTYTGVDEANKKFSEEDIERYRSGAYPWTNPNTDWVDESFKKSTLSNSHNVSLNGGSKSVSYYVSFGSQQDAGIFKNSPTKFNRYNLKANFDARINEYLTIGLDVNGIQEGRKYPSTDAGFNLDGAIKSLPTSPAFYPNGLPGPDIAYGQNPAVTVTDKTGFDDSTNYRVNTIFSANLKIPWVKGLSLASYFAYDVTTGNRKRFQKPWTLYQLDEGAYRSAGNTGVEDGSAFLSGSLKGTTEPNLTNYYNDGKFKTFNIKADYTNTFNGVHNLSAFVAFETFEFEEKGTSAFRRYFVSDQLPYLGLGGDAEKTNSEFVNIDSRVNIFGRISYNYKETYLFQFSLRRDGSLRFAEDSRWGNFPSVLAGWRVSNEEFWKNNVRFIDYFKLKASYGQLGNDLIDPFQYLSSFGVSTGYVLGPRSYTPGLTQGVEANPNITWEVANIYNVGFESQMLNSKLTLNADFFYQRRSNILVHRNASVPQFTGITLPDENFGIVDSRGLEVVLGYGDRAGEFNYSINGNIAFARNKIIEFDEPAKSVAWQRLTNKPQGSQLVYNAIGVYRDQEQIDKSVHVSGAKPGDIIIEDYDGNGEINTDDQILNTKTVNPEVTYGISINLGYKNWALSALVQGAGGTSRQVLIGLQGLSGNYFAYDAEGRWTPDNIDASKPRAFERGEAYWRENYVTNYSYQNGDYGRLKNVQLSYTIPATLQSKLRLKNAQIYVSGQNLLLIYNKNKYLDPEVGGLRVKASDGINSGAYNYPIMKVFTVGARLSF